MTVDDIKTMLECFCYDVEELIRLQYALTFVEKDEDINLYPSPSAAWEMLVPNVSPKWTEYYNLFEDKQALRREINGDIEFVTKKIDLTLELLYELDYDELELIYYKFERKWSNKKIADKLGYTEDGIRKKIDKILQTMTYIL